MNTVKQAATLMTAAQTRAVSWPMVYAISAALIIGTLIIATVGFASPEIIHNAAHDIRHGLAFPCH